MTNKIHFVNPLLFCVFLGCSSDKKAASAPVESCTKSFVKNYNQVVHGISMTTELWDSRQTRIPRYWMKNVFALNRACQNFYSQHSGVRCMADIQQEATLVSAENILSYCNTAQDLTEKYSSPSTDSEASEDVPFENNDIEDLPEVVTEDPADNKSTQEPEAPQSSDETELLPVPNAEKIPNGTLPSLESPTAEDHESSTSFSDESMLVDIPSNRMSIIVLNISSVLTVLESREFVVSDGLIGSLQTPEILTKVQNNQPFCSLSSIQKDIWKDQLKKGSSLSVKQISDSKKTSQEFQQMTITLEDERTGLNLSCLKRSQEPFNLGELKKTLTGVLKIEVQ